MFSAALYARVRFLLRFCTRDRGCSAHPAFPAPSIFGGTTKRKPRAARAARTRTRICYLNGIKTPTASLPATNAKRLRKGALVRRSPPSGEGGCDEAIQLTFLLSCCLMDCFVARAPRNDGRPARRRTADAALRLFDNQPVWRDIISRDPDRNIVASAGKTRGSRL
jgi:hypothetical protein